ncbi:MAG: bifunctional diaminohydroxyphosphoribosylaminopyrimidine deaminase/5-amino-6-(5-phosphoribosylamino)uracil reductase RibD [Ignavibacteria bacterium]|nr:bifunctional diaminohydroxyphosphoribosylaminopyrimidine deaminase/5-amino-6-(5-phosphoribosylamino)uracil reductase RibD [Ignavibacteria bacterium]
MTKNKLMQIALELATKGGIQTFPNPNVGAVVFKDGKIIGQGYHRFFGDKHAEIHALNEAGAEAEGSTLVVTLEPCSHFGKTPPCVDAIIKSKVKKVIVGIVDPNPLVSGEGIKKLKEAGIEVEIGVLKERLQKFYSDYSKRFSRKKSFVVLKYAMTLDGKISTVSGDARWISSDKSRDWIHKFRTEFDGILVGVNTVIKDNPILTSHGKGKNPVRIILDNNLEIPLKAQVLNDDLPTVIICSSGSQRKIDKIKRLNKIVLQIKSDNEFIPFKKIIEELRKISIFSILIEGGGLTAWQALKDEIVDEIISIVAPKIIGGKHAVTPVEGEGFIRMSDAIKTKILEFKKIGDDIFIRSKVIK